MTNVDKQFIKKRKKIDILGLSNNRKLQQTKEKERPTAAASLCRGWTISCKNDSYIFLRLNEKKRADIKGGILEILTKISLNLNPFPPIPPNFEGNKNLRF